MNEKRDSVNGFIGIDWSLTGTGVASYQDGEWDTCTITSKVHDGTETGFLERVHDIAARIIAWADPHEGDVWAIEGPSFGAKGAAVDKMFGGWHVTMDDLIGHHSEPWVFAPSSVKKLATGKGNANKDAVLLATARRLPEAPVENNNEADAVWLTIAASIIAGTPIVTLPNTHTAGLTRALKGS